VPVLPVLMIAPIWDQLSVLLPEQPAVDPTHPLGYHRRRVSDRVVFDHVIAPQVHRTTYERIASPGCSHRTIRCRARAWAVTELMQTLHALVLAQYDRMIGPKLDDVAVDGRISKAPGAGRNPVDRAKQGRKRSVLVDVAGVPLGVVAEGENRHDGRLLDPALAGLKAWGPTHLASFRSYDIVEAWMHHPASGHYLVSAAPVK
jgi:hypothetical protein